MNAFEGKIAIITGGGRGIGESTARSLVARGARVVIASRSEAELKAVADSLGKDSSLAVPTDVGDENQIIALFKKAESHFGPVDFLVNNAGVARVSSIAETSLEDWDVTLDVNLRGTFLCARELFRRGRKAAIVNVSSLAGIKGVTKFPGMGAYAASKFGVIGLTEILALEGRSLGIRANAIAPGAVDTKMLRDAAPFLKTSTKPEDIANSIVFLLDDEQSAKLTGAVIEVYSNE